jgi:hypothetical protein
VKIGRPLSPEQVSKMTDEQKEQLKQLKQASEGIEIKFILYFSHLSL